MIVFYCLKAVRFSALDFNPAKRNESRLAKGVRLADFAHEPVLYLLQKQNREL